MRFRPITALLVTVIAGMSLVGCTVEFGGGPTGEFTSVKPGVLTVATEQVPTVGFWLGTEARPTGGFEYGLAKEMAEQFGLDRVEVRTVPFAKMIAGDLAGADLGLRELTPTPEREQNLDFSIPYISAPPAALVLAGTEVPDMKTAKELSWVVPEGTTLVGTLEDLIGSDEMTVGPDRAAVVHRVIDGEADAALFDLPVALALAGASGGKLEVAAQFNSSETFAAALPKGSSNLEPVNAVLRTLSNNGTLSGLAEEWLGVSLQSGSFSVSGIPLIR